jgi:hypothetical protein
MGSVDLVETPQQVLGSAIDVVPARVVWEIVAQWRTTKLFLKKVDLVEEQDDAGTHKPS